MAVLTDSIAGIRNVCAQRYHRLKATEYAFSVIIAVIIGIFGGLGAVGIRFMIKVIQFASFGQWQYSLNLIRSLPWYWIVLAPGIGGLAVGLIIQFFSREAKGHGVPEVMEALALRAGRIRPRVVLAKLCASAISIGTGGSVGREGPIVQIGSAIGSTMGQFLKVSPKMLRTFVGCGAAAGIAAAFNAPVAGALFAVEIILGDFGIARFSPIVISSVMATVISRYFLGNFPAFEVPPYDLVHPVELVFYTVMGFAAAFISILFIKVLYFCEDRFDSFRFPESVKALAGGLIIGVIALQYPEIFGVGYEAINVALHGPQSLVWLSGLIFVKLAATSITLGSGGSGGIFAPSLFLGAMLGGLIGNIVNVLFPGVSASPGAYALVGMGAIVAGTTRAPITAIVIIFELTSNYLVILPLMVACIISTLISSKMHAESIYTLKLVRRGVNLYKSQELNVLKSLTVEEVMSDSAEIVPENTPLTQLIEKSINSPHFCLYTTDDAGNLKGIISLHDLRSVIFERDLPQTLIIAQDIADSRVKPLTLSDSLDVAMQFFGKTTLDELPVVKGNHSGKIVGCLMKNDVIEAYNREIFRRDMLDQFTGQIMNLDRTAQFDLEGGYSLMEIAVPHAFIGRRFGALNIRKEFNVQVILIKKAAAVQAGNKKKTPMQFVPDPDYVIQPDDHFFVIGKKSKIDHLRYL